jgi:ABC-2 type transport system ATP-binding protein
MTLIVSSHILAELEDYSTHMLVLEKGKLIRHTAVNAEKTKESQVTLLLELTEDPTPYLPQIKAIENLTIKEIQAKSVIVLFKGEERDQHLLLKNLIDNHVPVYSIQLQKQSLRELYLDITHGKKSEDKSSEPKS